ncbi:MAG: hypothetical protein IJ301_01465 [Clostridia bacterium]|nr:hypothetical protein [Clostridia bacterium]
MSIFKKRIKEKTETLPFITISELKEKYNQDIQDYERTKHLLSEDEQFSKLLDIKSAYNTLMDDFCKIIIYEEKRSATNYKYKVNTKDDKNFYDAYEDIIYHINRDIENIDDACYHQLNVVEEDEIICHTSPRDSNLTAIREHFKNKKEYLIQRKKEIINKKASLDFFNT